MRYPGVSVAAIDQDQVRKSGKGRIILRKPCKTTFKTLSKAGVIILFRKAFYTKLAVFFFLRFPVDEYRHRSNDPLIPQV